MAHTSSFPFRMTYEYRGRVYERDMNAQDFRRAFGFTGPYPADAHGEVLVNGRPVTLRAKTQKRMEMRVLTHCPDCGKEMNPGKLLQHLREKKRWEQLGPANIRKPGETNRNYRQRMDSMDSI